MVVTTTTINARLHAPHVDISTDLFMESSAFHKNLGRALVMRFNISSILWLNLRRNGPSELIKLDDNSVWYFDESPYIPFAMELLVRAVEAENVIPLVNCGGIFCPPKRPNMPKGAAQL